MEISFEDRLAIERQIYEYAYTFDTGDVDGFVAVFTDDAVYDAYLVGQDQPLTTIRGAAELRKSGERGTGPGAVPFLHHTASVVFDELNTAAARTRSTVIATMQLLSGPTIANHGVYHDRWRKTPEGWRIEYRRYVMAGHRSAKDVPSQV